MQTSSSPRAGTAGLPASRRFFRRIRSGVLRFQPVYRLVLRLKYGAAAAARPPQSPLPNQALQSRAEWEQAVRQGKQLRLPLHRDAAKNWDHLAAVYAIAASFPLSAVVLDAGAEFYSNVLPALFACGFEHLYGMNLSFSDAARRGPIRYLPGDITRTDFGDAFFDAITCMSVIEHGVPLRAYFQEMYRLLKPGGLLITSTDYYPEPVDTRNQLAYGAPIRIFCRQEAEQMLALAQECGLEPTGAVDLNCAERPVRWDPFGLEYSYLIFTLRKPLAAGKQ